MFFLNDEICVILTPIDNTKTKQMETMGGEIKTNVVLENEQRILILIHLTSPIDKLIAILNIEWTTELKKF